MPVPFKYYVDITSGVGAGVNVGNRQLIARLFDDNPLIPPDSQIDFETADDVSSYFGSSSLEAARAAFYFGWISKSITTPQTLSYARWASADSAPRIYGAKGAQAYTSYTGITTGAFILTLNGLTHTVSPMNFGAVTSLTDVASVVQTAIAAAGFPALITASIATDPGGDILTVTAADGVLEIGQSIAGAGVISCTITALGTGTGGTGTYILSTTSQTVGSEAMTAGTAIPLWTGVVVAWDSLNQRFILTGGAVGDANVLIEAGTGGNDVAAQLGWLSATTILSDGADEQTITDVLSTSAEANNNFGSFAFTATLTTDQITEAATWNDDQNVMFMYSVPVTASTASAIAAAVADLSGVTLTLAPLATEYPEMAPMMIEAATDYAAPNSTVNYMFQQFDLTPSVLTQADATIYDDLRINYYAQTQTAGQLINLYQRGVMQGMASDPLDQNTYANEQWLKDAAGAAIMTLLMTLTKISANNQGISQILSALQGVINQALANGTISVGKVLTNAQQLFITQVSNDPLAWKQVQNLGYWVTVVMVPIVVDNSTQYEAKYTLLYSKDDVVRKVVGSDILI